MLLLGFIIGIMFGVSLSILVLLIIEQEEGDNYEDE